MASAPLMPPVAPVVPGSAGSSSSLPSADLISSLLSSSDAESDLAGALIDLQLRLSSRGVAAAVFLVTYGYPDILQAALRHRRYMAGDKGIVDALASVALKKFMKGLSIMLGNK